MRRLSLKEDRDLMERNPTTLASKIVQHASGSQYSQHADCDERLGRAPGVEVA
jgi:hypothetical protein